MLSKNLEISIEFFVVVFYLEERKGSLSLNLYINFNFDIIAYNVL